MVEHNEEIKQIVIYRMYIVHCTNITYTKCALFNFESLGIRISDVLIDTNYLLTVNNVMSAYKFSKKNNSQLNCDSKRKN